MTGGELFMGFEILSLVGIPNAPSTFWARATWDPDITLYASNKPLLRKKIRDFWEAR